MLRDTGLPMCSEVLGQQYLTGEWVFKSELEGHRILVHDCRVMKSVYGGRYAIVQAQKGNRFVTFFTTSLMLKQLQQVKGAYYPLWVRVKKKDNYWRFVRDD